MILNDFSYDFDNIFIKENNDLDADLLPANTVYPVVRRFLTYFECKNGTDTPVVKPSREKFECLCRYLNKSMESESTKLSYAALCLHKDKRCVLKLLK